MEPASGGLRDFVDQVARTPLSLVVLWMMGFTAIRLLLYPWSSRPKGAPALRFLTDLLDAMTYAGGLVFMVLRPFVLQAYNIPSGSMVPTLAVDDFVIANKAVYRFRAPQRGEVVVFRPPREAVNESQLDDSGRVNVDFIKRCVGVPGDIIEVRDNVLYLNGKPYVEPYKRFMAEEVPGVDKDYREMRPDEVLMQPRHDFKLAKFKGRYFPVSIQDDSINDSDVTAPAYQSHNARMSAQLKDLPPVAVPPDHFLMFGDNRYHSYDSRSWGLVPRRRIVGRADVVWLPLGHFRIGLASQGGPVR